MTSNPIEHALPRTKHTANLKRLLEPRRKRNTTAVIRRVVEQELEQRRKWLESQDPVDSLADMLAGYLGPPQSEDDRWQSQLRAISLRYIQESFRVPDPESTWRDYAAEALSNGTDRYLRLLGELAERGDPQALLSLAKLSIELVERTNRLALLNGTRLRPFTTTCFHWPVLKSPHPGFAQSENQFFQALAIGSSPDLPILDVCCKWKPDDEAGRLALDAWREITFARNHVPLVPQFGSRWRIEARDLPRFREDPLAWFRVARERWEAEPSMLTTLNKKVPRKKQRKDGELSSHVFKMLREKFLSMAGDIAETAKARAASRGRCTN